MIKHAHPEFPSDIFIVLAAAKATVSIAETDGIIRDATMEEFLKLNMENKIILKVKLPQLDKSKFKFKSYKIMKRAQNTHAYVNAGFLFELGPDQNTVQSANICFGGINNKFINASLTEKALVGQKLFQNETMKSVFATLDKELNVITWERPDADPKYRKNLAISLLYKAIINFCPSKDIQASIRSGGELLTRPISTGTQEFDTYEADYPITKAIPKYEGLQQTAGEAKYSNDLPSLPGELWAVFVQATEVGSKIKNINPEAALKEPGVHGFFSAKDVPGLNSFTPLRFKIFYLEHEEIFCSDTVLYYGQPLGLIVADSVNLASQAAKLVKVEYEKTGGWCNFFHTNPYINCYPFRK